MEKGNVREILKNICLVVFDFDGVFTDNRVIVSQDGKESIICSRSDGLGLELLRNIGVESFILSTETNPVVKYRAKKLKIRCYSGCKDKLQLLKKIIIKRKIDPSCVAYVGNDINDLSCLKFVGIPVAVADAYMEVKKASKIVMKKKGGDGTVREFCQLLYDAKQK